MSYEIYLLKVSHYWLRSNQYVINISTVTRVSVCVSVIIRTRPSFTSSAILPNFYLRIWNFIHIHLFVHTSRSFVYVCPRMLRGLSERGAVTYITDRSEKRGRRWERNKTHSAGSEGEKGGRKKIPRQKRRRVGGVEERIFDSREREKVDWRGRP